MENAFKKYKVLPFVLILPAITLILVFKIYPILKTLIDGFVVNSRFSLSTYSVLFQDPTFWNSLWVTLKINLVMIPLQILISLLLALAVNVDIKGIGVFRTIFYLPVTISLTVAVLLWNLMMNPNGGVLNSIFSVFGIPAQTFLMDRKQALWCIVIIATWKGVGYWMMFLLAGLKGIDTSIYEAARIDGANYWRIVRSITIPLIKPVLLFVLVANTTANLLLFIPMQMVTKGGPEGSTDVLMYEAYKSSFMFINPERSAALVTILLVIIVLICVVQFRFMSDHDNDSIVGGN